MIQEVAFLQVTPGLEATFEHGVSAAAPLFQRAKGCRGLSLERSVERPSSYQLRVDWDTVEDHMVHFRGSEDFARWRELVGHCFAAPPRVEHAHTVLKAF
jgi:heme-degrading monooxygenase HmoA